MFRSGRTIEQGMRAAVPEGDRLYVTPRRFAMMQKILATAEDADQGAYEALRAAGMLPEEIDARRYKTTEIVVDYELSS